MVSPVTHRFATVVYVLAMMKAVPANQIADTEGMSLWPTDPGEYHHQVNLNTNRPLVVAHRGSSGILPEHTLAAYKKAIDQNADVIECDVTLTLDLVPVCLHESWMNDTTDVAAKFPGRLKTRYILGEARNITDYFSVDFTLSELKTLRVNQRFDFRDSSYNGQFEIATLEEYIQVAQNASRLVGIYPETKDPEWINSLDIIRDAQTSFEEIVVETVSKYGYTGPRDPCFLQSFSEQSLKDLSNITDLPLVMLTSGNPATDEQLERWSHFCYGIGPSKRAIVQVDGDNLRVTGVTDLVERAHARGLKVHPYTFRNEDQYLAWDYGQDPYAEYNHLLRSQVDGYFTDFPASLQSFLTVAYSTCSAALQLRISGLATLVVLLNVVLRVI